MIKETKSSGIVISTLPFVFWEWLDSFRKNQKQFKKKQRRFLIEFFRGDLQSTTLPHFIRFMRTKNVKKIGKFRSGWEKIIQFSAFYEVQNFPVRKKVYKETHILFQLMSLLGQSKVVKKEYFCLYYKDLLCQFMYFIKRKSFILFLSLAFLMSLTFSQSSFIRNDSIKIFVGTQKLLNPWAGGLNSTQFSNVDVDLDGKKDIVTFDKGSFKIRCFKNTGSTGFSQYKHAPQYEKAFPAVTDFLLMKDYNMDGLEDIFTYTSGGMKVYRNTSSVAAGLQFALAYSLIYSNYNPAGTPNMVNLYCSPVGIPGIADMDNDGDLDVLTFSVFGTEIEYHQNRAVESGLPLDSLKFEMTDQCWGDFDESTCVSYLNDCPYFLKLRKLQNPLPKPDMHAGSCLTCLDNDGDGDLDLILGDISCDSLEFYYNTGDIHDARVDSATKKYPKAKPLKMSYYPCTYFIDTDNDGVRDLLASPNSTPGSENFTSAWRYKNTGSDSSPVFNFIESNFLQDSMIDFGEGAYPALFDENADGLTDIIVGGYGYFNNPSYTSRLALLRNTGTAALPQFTLVTRNYAGISTYNIADMAPAFGDLDGDGDSDLIIGDNTAKLTYFKNTAGAGTTANFVFVSSYFDSIDAPGSSGRPQIIDVNRDGLNDILIGTSSGKVYYYPNTGSPTVPYFSKTPFMNTNLGGVKVTMVNSLSGYAAPCMVNRNGSYELLVGSEKGWIFRYGNIDGNLAGNFTLIDSMGWNLWEGGKTVVSVGNIDNDNLPDMIMGNYDGGLAYLKGDTSTMIGIKTDMISAGILLFPNPAHDELTISFCSKIFEMRQIEIYDVSGRLIKSIKSSEPVIKIAIEEFAEGLYILQYYSGEGENGAKRFAISR